MFEYKTISFSGDSVCSTYSLKYPNYIKIDVDGIEHIVLNGMRGVLRSTELRSILVEINDNFEEQRFNVMEILNEAGFYLADKRTSEYDLPGCYNYIWNKDAC